MTEKSYGFLVGKITYTKRTLFCCYCLITFTLKAKLNAPSKSSQKDGAKIFTLEQCVNVLFRWYQRDCSKCPCMTIHVYVSHKMFVQPVPLQLSQCFAPCKSISQSVWQLHLTRWFEVAQIFLHTPAISGLWDEVLQLILSILELEGTCEGCNSLLLLWILKLQNCLRWREFSMSVDILL